MRTNFNWYYMRNFFLFNVALVVGIFYAFPLHAQVRSQVGDGSTYYCIGYDAGDGLYEGYLYRVRRNREISYRTAVREVNARITDFRKRIRAAQRRRRSTVRLEASLAMWQETRKDLDECRNYGYTLDTPPSTPSPSPGTNATACQVVGSSLRNSIKIIGGSQCAIGNSPVVAVELYNAQGNSEGACTGTVVAPPGASTSNQILFAAHCMDGVSYVRINTPSGKMTSSYVAAFPGWGSGVATEDGDVAIATFSSAIPTRIMTINTSPIPLGQRGVIGGYGQDENGEASISRLKAGDVRIADINYYGISIQYNGAPGANTCFGDSGGPLFVEQSGQWVLAGITSNGERNDCGVGDVSSFANLQNSSVKAWVNSIVSGLIP